MITKNGLLRPSRNNSLITSPKSKTKPSKPESSEPDIDFSNIPTIQGTYKASKVNNTSANRTNSTQETTKPQPDAKHTKGSLAQEQTTIKFTSTEGTTRPVSSVVQTTTLRIKEKVNHTVHDERGNEATQGTTERVVSTSTMSTTSTTQAKVEDLFKDFRKPDLETSPWKPIIPGYVNTELKLLPGSAGKTNHKVNYNNTNPGEAASESTTRIPQYSVEARLPESSTQQERPSEQPEPVNSYVDVPGMSTFDSEDTDFPRDRIVPQEMVNFRVNGKFKNKIPGLMEDGQIFTAPPPPVKLEEGTKPDIEVSGQLPSETYDVKLRTSSDPGKTESPYTKPYRPTNENETGWRVPAAQVSYRVTEGDSMKINKKGDGSATDTKGKESSDNSLLSVSPSTQRWHVQRPSDSSGQEDSTTEASRVGVAEVVSDTDIELEARNRYSDVQAVTKHHNDALQDRKVDKNAQEPVYTSYKTPDLNGAGLKHSLIENSGTLKPFRHTIPVDKLTSVMNYDGSGKGNSSLTQEVNGVTDSAMSDGGKFSEDGEAKDEGNSLRRNLTEPEGTKVLSGSLKEVEVEAIVEDSNGSSEVSAPMKHGKIELSERGRPTESSTRTIIDDEKVLKLSTTEVYSEMIHPLHNNVDKLVMQGGGSKQTPPGRFTPSISRNSTFIEIDTLKHTPGQAENSSSFESEPPFNKEEELDWIFNGTVNRPSSPLETKKKVYNDTLKAYVVENLVTLAPAKSNTGVGRPVRPRPKIDKEKEAEVIEKSSNRSSSDDTTLLEQLFGVQSRDRNVTEEGSSDDKERLVHPSESSRHQPRIEQIVEVVTSISTKVSSNIKDDPIVLKLVVTNSTSLPVIHWDSREEEPSTPQASVLEELSLGVDQEENRSFRDRPIVAQGPGEVALPEKPPASISTSVQTIQTSDRKISTIEENRFLLEKLKQLAEVGSNDTPAKSSKNHSRPIAAAIKAQAGDVKQEARPLFDFEKLKEIADIATGNETLMNSSAGFTMTRDGVEIFTKILNKVEDRADKMISTTENSKGAGNYFTESVRRRHPSCCNWVFILCFLCP